MMKRQTFVISILVEPLLIMPINDIYFFLSPLVFIAQAFFDTLILVLRFIDLVHTKVPVAHILCI